jgi:hypothetical protein
MHSMVIGLFASAVAETVGNAGFGSCASMVFGVVLNFLSHDDLLLAIVGAEVAENVAARWFRCAATAVLILRTGFVDRTRPTWAAFCGSGYGVAHFYGPKRRALMDRAFAAIVCRFTSVRSYMVSLHLAQLANAAYADASIAYASLDRLLDDDPPPVSSGCIISCHLFGAPLCCTFS